MMKRGAVVILVLAAQVLLPGPAPAAEAGPAPTAEAGSTAHAILPLPAVPVPDNNPLNADKIRLGRMLFFDPRLSGDSSTSCASCHVPEMGWTHSDALAKGYPGHRLWRNNPTVLNAAHFRRLMWDGGLDSLEIQARSAMQAPVEGNVQSATMVETRLRFVPEYVSLFRQVFSDEQPQLEHAWQAIATYERTLVSDPRQVPYERYLAGQRDALGESARRGLALFEGKAGCAQCHSGAMASDEEFHALGVPRQALYDSHPLVQIAVRWQNAQRRAPQSLLEQYGEDLGRWYVTRQQGDIGKFRTPSLRELKYTAPYMHNGVFNTLREVVDFFDAGGGEAANKSPRLKPLGLSEQEKRDLVAFLRSLSMDEPLRAEVPELPPIRPLVR